VVAAADAGTGFVPMDCPAATNLSAKPQLATTRGYAQDSEVVVYGLWELDDPAEKAEISFEFRGNGVNGVPQTASELPSLRRSYHKRCGRRGSSDQEHVWYRGADASAWEGERVGKSGGGGCARLGMFLNGILAPEIRGDRQGEVRRGNNDFLCCERRQSLTGDTFRFSHSSCIISRCDTFFTPRTPVRGNFVITAGRRSGFILAIPIEAIVLPSQQRPHPPSHLSLPPPPTWASILRSCSAMSGRSIVEYFRGRDRADDFPSGKDGADAVG